MTIKIYLLFTFWRNLCRHHVLWNKHKNSSDCHQLQLPKPRFWDVWGWISSLGKLIYRLMQKRATSSTFKMTSPPMSTQFSTKRCKTTVCWDHKEEGMSTGLASPSLSTKENIQHQRSYTAAHFMTCLQEELAMLSLLWKRKSKL